MKQEPFAPFKKTQTLPSGTPVQTNNDLSQIDQPLQQQTPSSYSESSYPNNSPEQLQFPAASPAMIAYFTAIEKEVSHALSYATKARRLGYDPEPYVDIPLARTMAERVEGLISIAAPHLVGSGMTQRIKKLEEQYGALDWRVALKIGEEVAKGKFCKFQDLREAIEVGIRVGMAYNTAGIVAAPLEGFIEAKIKKRNDGQEYLAVYYAGPIRGAGGTAAAFSVVLADYIRTQLGLAAYDPTFQEIERTVLEIQDYHERVTNLQYFPSAEEIRFLIRNIPVEISGDPTEKVEVSNYKDLARIETNYLRGGLCLVLAEGLAQKAPKLWKRLEKWGAEFGISWEFLSAFLDLKAKIHATHAVAKEEEQGKITPNNTYITDAVAGRPIFGLPMRPGGFRLRYGKGRNNGFSAASIHPATMVVLDNYLAIGTQLKIERPGKGAALTTNDTIDGPIVLLDDGAVVQITDIAQAKRLHPSIKEILFLGDILFSYGDFSENGHKLVPPGYCPEWWVQELVVALLSRHDVMQHHTLSASHPDALFSEPLLSQAAALFSLMLGISKEQASSYLLAPLRVFPTASQALTLSETLQIPYHPSYSYFFTLLTYDDFFYLFHWLSAAKVIEDEKGIIKLVCKHTEKAKTILEKIGAPHLLIHKEFIVIASEVGFSLLLHFGLLDSKYRKKPGPFSLPSDASPSPLQPSMSADESTSQKKKSDALVAAWYRAYERKEALPPVLTLLQTLSGIPLRDKAGTFIGARMGRPEKAKMRKLIGSPHTLFPVGEQGGRLRSLTAAVAQGMVEAQVALFYCDACKAERLFLSCEICKQQTQPRYVHPTTGAILSDPVPGAKRYALRTIPLKELHDQILATLNIPEPELVKGVRGTANKDHLPEHPAKGYLRAKYQLAVNKDGTTRYDLTELPQTHFKPKEIHVSVERLLSLGYTHDYLGNPLVDDQQILELKPQDIIIPANPSLADASAADVLLRISKFIDHLLVSFYGMEPYYNAKTKEDLIGCLVIGLAPHISAGMIGRIIGFTQAQALFAHPLWHAALRRDCDGDEACLLLLMDAFLNFSRQFLPD
ncbi:MAG: hypothetical protein QW594_01535, partial [Candidatus Woesearchaeota archaeon]